MTRGITREVVKEGTLIGCRHCKGKLNRCIYSQARTISDKDGNIIVPDDKDIVTYTYYECSECGFRYSKYDVKEMEDASP